MPVTISFGSEDNWPTPLPPPREIGLENVVSGREDEFPILARALEDSGFLPHPLRFEWEVPGPEGIGVTWFNWAQIFRTPWMQTRTQIAARSEQEEIEYAKKKFLTEHLRKIEQTLHKGYLFQNFSWHVDEDTGVLYKMEHRGMGGVEFYLGRDLRPDDKISLRILRDLAHRELTSLDYDGRQDELLCEISLIVRPG